ncbi:MAG: fused MFS/spermidine synthase, partial [Alphaproteobacteria bacterium]|nr:fused MFS/spermidine synthase [Alphaproteobacteria bacterium]
ATYLLGLVLGALVCARWISRDKSALLASFARVQLGIGVAAAISLGFAGQVATLLHALDYSALDASGLAKLGLVVALVVLAPTTLIGMSFPLASELAVHRLSALGSRVGLLYSLNTYGGVLGSLCAGLVLLPLIGVQAAFVLFVLGNFALFGALWLTQPELRGFPGLKREAALSAGMVAVVLVLLGPGYIRRQLTLYPGEKLVYEETEDATFMVLQHDDPLVGPFQQLVVNGTSYANNRPEGRRYMALLAHLPMLLHPEPTETVVICVGTGTTIGAASLHDRARQVWSVDVTRHVFGYAKHFVPLNNHFFEKPHVHQVASDGRHFLQVTDRRFDVLTFEPPPPIESGVVNLYSREFYELADARLAEGGIVAQWIPFQQGFEEIHRMLVRTMDDVFPHTSLWIPNRDEGILIGSHQPLRIDYAALAERMREPDVARDLHEVGIDSPEDLLATFVGADDDLRAYVGDVPVVTDDHPFVEHFFRYPNDRFDVRDALAHGTPIEAVLTGPLPDPDAMAHARRAQEKLWDAERNIRGQQWQAADADLTAALAERPGNTYLTFIQGVTRRVMERRQSGAGDPR